MPKKKKPRPFRVVSEIKAMARERIGAPPAEKIVPDKKKKRETEKHPRTIAQLLDDLD